jgi:hypothetical protein
MTEQEAEDQMTCLLVPDLQEWEQRYLPQLPVELHYPFNKFKFLASIALKVGSNNIKPHWRFTPRSN